MTEKSDDPAPHLSDSCLNKVYRKSTNSYEWNDIDMDHAESKLHIHMVHISFKMHASLVHTKVILNVLQQKNILLSTYTMPTKLLSQCFHIMG